MPPSSRHLPVLLLACACHVGEDGNAFEAGEAGDDGHASSGASESSATEAASTTGASADEGSADDSSGAVQYDVGDESEGEPTGPGSCRMHESYGAAGGSRSTKIRATRRSPAPY